VEYNDELGGFESACSIMLTGNVGEGPDNNVICGTEICPW